MSSYYQHHVFFCLNQREDGGDARTDLEGAVRDVLVRYPIAREVKEQGTFGFVDHAMTTAELNAFMEG